MSVADPALTGGRSTTEAQVPAGDENTRAIEGLLEGRSGVDQWMIRWGDRLSPIVVKETRQALKSKQFVWTMILLLVCTVGWTMIGIASQMPDLYFFPAGMTLLTGYICMLMVPALLIVPIAAFFSMAGELNANTFDVLSITPLTSRRIVWGKIIVALVQLALFFSVLAPCIALTYLLRGVSISDLLNLLPLLASVAFLLVSLSVVLGTFSRTVFQMILCSFLQMAAGIAALFSLSGFIFGALMSGGGFGGEWEAYVAVWLFIAFILSYGYLATLVASASIGIIGENYARPIRLWVAVQAYAIFVASGAVAWWFDQGSVGDGLAFALVATAMHWAGVGVFLVSQSGSISPRTQRTLPRRLSSRMLLSWLNPGGGTGYFFVVLNYGALLLAYLLIPAPKPISREMDLYLNVIFGYLVFYLGALRLVMLAIPATVPNRSGVGVFLAVLLLSLGSGVPIFMSMAANDFERWTYETYSVFNIFATFADIYEAQGSPTTLLNFSAVLVLLLNAVLVSRDIVLVRVRAIEDRDAPARTPEPAADPFA